MAYVHRPRIAYPGAAGSLRSAVSAGLQTYSLPVVGKTIDGNAVLLLQLVRRHSPRGLAASRQKL